MAVGAARRRTYRFQNVEPAGRTGRFAHGRYCEYVGIRWCVRKRPSLLYRPHILGLADLFQKKITDLVRGCVARESNKPRRIRGWDRKQRRKIRGKDNTG